MCTILFLHRVHPDHALVIAANRDENHARRSRGPGLIAHEPATLAGLDEVAGGTWMGANGAGLAVGLTNLRTYAPTDPGARSRGDVVRDVLRARTHREACRQLDRIDCREFNPFNLLIGTAERVQLAYARRDRREIEIVDAPPGIHVLPNDRLGCSGFPKAARAVTLAERLPSRPWPEFAQGLGAIMGDHALPDIETIERPPRHSIHDLDLLHRHQAICIHGSGYGTRSSTMMAISSGRVDHYLFADGSPCTTPFVEYAQLLDEEG